MRSGSINENKIWALSLGLWAIGSLSFMVGMGVSSAIFTICSLFFIMRGQHSLSVLAMAKNPLALATYVYLFAVFLSVICMYLFPPLGLPVEAPAELKKLHFFLLPFLAAFCLLSTSGKDLELEKNLLWDCLYWMALLVCVVGCLQFWAYYIFPAQWLQNRFFRVATTGSRIPVFHAQGFMYFHLSFASAIAFVHSYAWARVFWPLAQDRAKIRLQWFLLSCLTSMVLFYTFSRISWIVIGASFIAFGFLKRPRWGGVVAIAIVAIFFAFWSFSSTVRGRVELGWISIFERENVWMASAQMVKERPLTGVGFGKTVFYSRNYAEKALGREPDFSSHSHNNILDVFAGTGLFGLLAFLFWWIALWRYAWRAFCLADPAEKWLPAACLVAWVAFQINGLTQVNFFDAKSQHSLMLWAGVVLALELRRCRRNRA